VFVSSNKYKKGMYMNNTLGIIIARFDSARLPGKALVKVGDNPLIWYVFERAKRIKGLAKIVLATTTRSIDDPLVRYAYENDIDVYRGSLENVAQRVLDCAEQYKADYFLRINADSPFLDNRLVEIALRFCNKEYDFITNIIGRTFPYGVSVEIVKINIYKKIINLFSLEDKEHVTKFFYDNPNLFRIKSIKNSNDQLKSVKLVVDTSDDLEIFKKIVAHDPQAALFGRYQEISKLYEKIGAKI
jgi:spore coat polysaccharide biosynthesis protein SpsF (cytidylyltransferase family)